MQEKDLISKETIVNVVFILTSFSGKKLTQTMNIQTKV